MVLTPPLTTIMQPWLEKYGDTRCGCFGVGASGSTLRTITRRRFREFAVDRLAVQRLLSGRSAISKRQEANNLARIWSRPRPLGRHAHSA